MRKKAKLIISWFLLIFAQPDFSIWACVLASALGYALFWNALSEFALKKRRFLIALLFFASVQAVHLGWFTSDKYVGWYIYIFLTLLTLFLGACFALFSLLNLEVKRFHLKTLLALTSLWTLFEWGRLFILSGFSWNPVGLALSATLYGRQWASLWGVFGLTFWVILTNLFAFKALALRSIRTGLLFVMMALLPYGFGYMVVKYHEKKVEEADKLSLLLVQTALYPEEKFPLTLKAPLPPLEQWRRIFDAVKKYEGEKIDLIVLSEAVVPYGTHHPLYSFDEVGHFMREMAFALPKRNGEKRFDNAYFARSLADHFDADVIIGLEDKEESKVYNAAFVFHPFTSEKERYEKRVLVPLGEYIPFSFCERFLAYLGIFDSFIPGSEAKVFRSKSLPLGISICYEETYGHLMRENRQKGAKLLVNVTNDAWYPRSRLPIVHFCHGRLRSVEGGIPLVRATNTGVTCVVDSLSRMVDSLPFENRKEPPHFGVLHCHLSSYSYKTLYTIWGDTFIVAFSLWSIISCVKTFRQDTFSLFRKTRKA